MSWKKGAEPKHSQQEVAEQVLQTYIKYLQDHKSLKNILSECCVLDYFGKVFYGQEKVATHLISNLHGSNFELSSLSFDNQPSLIQWKPNSNSQEKADDDLGVTLISPPKFTFPSITFSTPVRNFSMPKKRTASEASVEDCSSKFKKCKTENKTEQGSSSNKTDEQNLLSPESLPVMLHKDLRFLTAYGTIRCPKRVLPTMDLKRIKHHSSVALRGRFCQLYIGFECDEHIIGLTNFKIRTIKYNFSSKVTPRNLLKAFNEVEMGLNNKVVHCKLSGEL